MREDPFVILGVERGATQNEIYNAYKALRNRYEEERFLEGEAGADAARRLQELDIAYAEALEYNHLTATVENDGTNYSEIKRALTEKNLERAQALLDNTVRRDAEWHYLQSIVFYERNWFVECRKQLQIALELEPANEKYQKSLKNLETKINREAGIPQDIARTYEQSQKSYGTGGARSYDPNRPTQSSSNGLCNVCTGLLCADCCCECMGGDLIRCC
jgi:molecular chaperone DnaJ